MFWSGIGGWGYLKINIITWQWNVLNSLVAVQIIMLVDSLLIVLLILDTENEYVYAFSENWVLLISTISLVVIFWSIWKLLSSCGFVSRPHKKFY